MSGSVKTGNRSLTPILHILGWGSCWFPPRLEITMRRRIQAPHRACAAPFPDLALAAFLHPLQQDPMSSQTNLPSQQG